MGTKKNPVTGNKKCAEAWVFDVFLMFDKAWVLPKQVDEFIWCGGAAALSRK